MKYLRTLLLAALLTGCGGTFTLQPDGTLSYKTPELIKPPIVQPAK